MFMSICLRPSVLNWGVPTWGGGGPDPRLPHPVRELGRQVATCCLFAASKDASGRLSRRSSDRSRDVSGHVLEKVSGSAMRKVGDAGGTHGR